MKHKLILSTLSVLFIVGCSETSSNDVPDIHPSLLYEQINTDLQEGDWTDAVQNLEALDSRYPFGPYSEQAQLDLIYAYYKNGDYDLALASVERFMRLKPIHPRMDWALYMRGLIYQGLDKDFMHSLFNIDRSERDPEPSKKAFLDYKRLVQQFPNSEYSADAKQRMIALKNRLSKYDLASADFYLRRKAWISAINRCQEVQKTYPDTNAARQCLEIQLEAYQELKMDDSISRTQELIKINPVE